MDYDEGKQFEIINAKLDEILKKVAPELFEDQKNIKK